MWEGELVRVPAISGLNSLFCFIVWCKTNLRLPFFKLNEWNDLTPFSCSMPFFQGTSEIPIIASWFKGHFRSSPGDSVSTTVPKYLDAANGRIDIKQKLAIWLFQKLTSSGLSSCSNLVKHLK